MPSGFLGADVLDDHGAIPGVIATIGRVGML